MCRGNLFKISIQSLWTVPNNNRLTMALKRLYFWPRFVYGIS